MPFSSLELARIFSQVDPPIEVMPDEIGEDLSIMFEEVAFAYARTDPDKALESCPEFVGYLRRALDDDQIYVPWPLSPLSPDRVSMSALIEVGRQIVMKPVESFCISGSSAMMGAGFTVADLDFSQYVEIAPSNLATDLRRFLVPDGPIVAVKVTYGNSSDEAVSERYPWPANMADVMGAMSHDDVNAAKRLMVDFVARTPQFGSLPVSNVVLCCSFGDRSVGAASKSWVFQEALVVSNSAPLNAPIWHLADPLQLAAFLKFLIEQMNYYVGERPLKAAKRALMFARVVRLHDLGDRLLDVLKQPESTSYVVATRDQEVRGLLQALNEDARKRLVRDLEHPTSPEEHATENVLPHGVLDRCKELVTELDLEWKMLLAAARKAPGGAE